jgi:hypothetical protein
MGLYAAARGGKFNGASVATLASTDGRLAGAARDHQLSIRATARTYVVSATAGGLVFALSGDADVRVATICAPVGAPLCLPTRHWSVVPTGLAPYQMKELAQTVEAVIETYVTDHSGSYAGATAQKLARTEPSLAPTVRANELIVDAGPTSYVVTIAEPGRWFAVVRKDDGTIDRSCWPARARGCQAGTW